MKYRAAAALLVALSLLLSGCSRRDRIFSDEAGSVGALFEIREMLREREAALLKGDEDAFYSNVDEAALENEETIFEGAKSVPLETMDFVFVPENQAPGSLTFTDVPVRAVFRYKGIPRDNTFEIPLNYSLSKVNESWKITESILGEATTPDWARTPLKFKESAHFLALYRPGLPKLDESIKAAEKAWLNLEKKLHLPQDSRYVMFLARDQAEFLAVTGNAELSGALAVARAQGDPGVARGRHMVADLAALFPDPAQQALEHGEPISATEVFQHELGHLALFRHTSSYTPEWVAEGAAMYLSGERREGGWRAMRAEENLDEDNSAIILGGEAPLSKWGYPFYNAAVLHLVEKFGDKKFWDFFQRYTREKPKSADPTLATSEITKTILHKVYGLTEKELDQQTRDYIKTHADG